MKQPDDVVWVADTALLRPPFAMAHHEPGRYDPEFGEMSACLYVHTWLRFRRETAETFSRPCQVCGPKRERALARAAAAAVRTA